MYFKMEAISTDLAMLQVHFSVARIAFMINAVGYMGDGSAMITEIYIPDTIEEAELGGSSNHEVMFTMLVHGETNEVVQPTAFEIEVATGADAPTFTEADFGGGRYRIEMKNQGGVVILSKQPSSGAT